MLVSSLVLLMSYLFNANLHSNNIHLTLKASETEWSLYCLVLQSYENKNFLILCKCKHGTHYYYYYYYYYYLFAKQLISY
jgi:hypothetical protein